jgi:hypothetical protein
MKAKRIKGSTDKCDRCRKRKVQYRIISSCQSICLPCFQLHQTEEERNPGVTKLMVYDFPKTAASKIAAVFAEAKLKPFEDGLNNSETSFYVCLKPNGMKVGDVTIKHRIPPKPKNRKYGWKAWVEARVLVRGDLLYPYTKKLTVGTVQIKDPVALALMKDKWFYEYENIEFKDAAELYAYGLGHACYKLLRHLKLIPGLATRVGCIKEGLRWLAEFREWRKREHPETLKPATKKGMEKPMAFVNA